MPTASITRSAPLPPVSARIAATGSCSFELTTWVAPKCSAVASFSSSRSTATIVVAPARAAPATAAAPTPPQPITATDSPRFTAPVLSTAPMPAITPHPSSPTAAYWCGSRSASILVHCPAATRVFSANDPMPRAGVSGVPSSSVILWVALWVAKQYQGSPLRQARHSPHTARQFRITWSPTATSVTPSPIADTTPEDSWPSRNG